MTVDEVYRAAVARGPIPGDPFPDDVRVAVSRLLRSAAHDDAVRVELAAAA